MMIMIKMMMMMMMMMILMMIMITMMIMVMVIIGFNLPPSSISLATGKTPQEIPLHSSTSILVICLYVFIIDFLYLILYMYCLFVLYVDEFFKNMKLKHLMKCYVNEDDWLHKIA